MKEITLKLTQNHSKDFYGLSETCSSWIQAISQLWIIDQCDLDFLQFKQIIDRLLEQNHDINYLDKSGKNALTLLAISFKRLLCEGGWFKEFCPFTDQKQQNDEIEEILYERYLEEAMREDPNDELLREQYMSF